MGKCLESDVYDDDWAVVVPYRTLLTDDTMPLPDALLKRGRG